MPVCTFSPSEATANRLEPVVIFHFPMTARISISDKNRGDLDWSNSKFTWRYRNRLTIERSFTISNYHPAPHVSAEVFYESQYEKWSSTNLYAGVSNARSVDMEMQCKAQNIRLRVPSYFPRFSFPHRALTAFLAISVRCADESFAARALPPRDCRARS